MILQSFEIFQGYLYQKFIKPIQGDGKTNESNAFITLMNDKWYFEQLQKKYQKKHEKKFIKKRRSPKKKLKSKETIDLNKKASIFFSGEFDSMNESKC